VWRDYIRAYGHIVAERFASGSTVSLSYFVGDHLGSVTVLSDSGQNEQEYDSYEVWGKRRQPSGAAWHGCFASNPKSLTLRGYTGEEMLDTYCLVNLNARLYDPSIGRMVSGDPTVPNYLSGQSYNRYSYVDNGPLSYVDPTGLAACPVNECVPVNGQGSYGSLMPGDLTTGDGGSFADPTMLSAGRDMAPGDNCYTSCVETVVVTAPRIPPQPIKALVMSQLQPASPFEPAACRSRRGDRRRCRKERSQL
jgi:RHS repeat-associated protein